MAEVASEIRIEAPKAKVWEIVADLGAVSVWNPVIAKSYYTSEAKEGADAGRHCDFPDGGYVKERVVEWKSGEALKMHVYDGSVPFDNFYGSYDLKDDGPGTVVKMTLGFDVKPGAPVDPAEAERQNREEMIPAVLGGLKHYVETGEPMPMPS